MHTYVRMYMGTCVWLYPYQLRHSSKDVDHFRVIQPVMRQVHHSARGISGRGERRGEGEGEGRGEGKGKGRGRGDEGEGEGEGR